MSETLTAVELAEKAARIKRAVPEAEVEIIGTWVWVTFTARPVEAVRELLKLERFRYNSKRQLWQFAGCRSVGSPKNSIELGWKYGRVEVEVEQAVAPSL